MNLDSEFGSAEKAERTWGLLLHLSVFAGYMSVGAGVIIPILIWQLKKDQYPVLDQHGRNLMNWLVSALIYGGLCFLLTFVFIGIPLGLALGVAMVVFPIIAGIKANNGEVWKYPLSIEFF